MKTLLSYGLGAVGFGMMLVALTTVVAANLNYASGKYTLVNMLRSAPNRGEMVLKSAPMTFYEPLHAVMKTLAMCRTSDPGLIAKTSPPTYDGACAGIAGKWTALMVKAKLGLMAVGGGLAVGLSKDTFPILLTIVTALAGGVFLWIYLKKEESERSLMRARAEVLPEVERCFIENRYILPPAPTA